MNNILTSIILILLTGCQQKETDTAQKGEKEDWWLWTVDWNPDETLIAAGGTQDTLRLFSVPDGKPQKNYRFEGTITKSKWHPTENKLAISTQSGTTKPLIFDVGTEARIELDSVAEFGARAIGWNKSGKLLAVGDYDGFLIIYDINGNVLKRIDTGQKALIGLDWHPTKNLIATVGDRITLYDFDIDTMTSVKARPEEVLMLCVEWHPSGEFFVSGDYGDFEKGIPPLLQFWTSKGAPLKSVEKSKAEYRNLRWSHDGQLLATASDYVRTWTKEGELVNEKKSENLLWGIDWNSSADKLVTSDEKGNIVIWDKDLNQLMKLPY